MIPVGQQNLPRSLALPPPGVLFENEHGIPAQRILVPPGSQWARHEYSSRRTVNCNGTQAVFLVNAGHRWLYHLDNGVWTPVKQLPGHAESNWHPTDPAVLLHFGKNGSGGKLRFTDTDTDLSGVAADFRGALLAQFPNADRVWTKNEGRPSDDGHYWTVMVDDASFNHVCLATFWVDIEHLTGQITLLDARVLPGRPDHVGTSRSGAYAYWDRSDGKRVAPIDNLSLGEFLLQNRSGHSDRCLHQGEDILVTANYGDGDVRALAMSDGNGVVLFDIYDPPGHSWSQHLSGLLDDHVLMSVYGSKARAPGQSTGPLEHANVGWNPDGTPTHPMQNRIIIAPLGMGSQVLQHYWEVGYTHWRHGLSNLGENTYWFEPQAQYDGGWVFYARADEAGDGSEPTGIALNLNGVELENGITVGDTTPTPQPGDPPPMAPTVDEGGSRTVRVHRNTEDLSQDLVVILASSDTGELVAPAQVVIPAGQAFADFQIDGIADAVVDGDQPATLTASAPGFPPISAQVDVIDQDSPTLAFEFL